VTRNAIDVRSIGIDIEPVEELDKSSNNSNPDWENNNKNGRSGTSSNVRSKYGIIEEEVINTNL
jgi:hypothetical protein